MPRPSPWSPSRFSGSVTTQVRVVRDVSPFADDPWDLVASFAAIFLPLVVAATFVRSVAHRGAAARDAGRRAGSRSGREARSRSSLAVRDDRHRRRSSRRRARPATRAGSSVGSSCRPRRRDLPSCTGFAAAVRWRRAAGRAPPAGRRSTSAPVAEPDVVDDALGLAVDVADSARLRGVRRPVAVASRFLDRSPYAARGDIALAFGVVLALAAAGRVRRLARDPRGSVGVAGRGRLGRPMVGTLTSISPRDPLVDLRHSAASRQRRGRMSTLKSTWARSIASASPQSRSASPQASIAPGSPSGKGPSVSSTRLP